MNNKNFIRNLALFAVIAGVVGISAVGAANPWENGEKKGWDNGERQEQRVEHREAMQAVLEAGDYQAFLELVGDKPISEIITENNFARFIEMHELMETGDREGAKAIAEELGLPVKHGKHGIMHKIIKDGGLKDVDDDGVCTIEENKPLAAE